MRARAAVRGRDPGTIQFTGALGGSGLAAQLGPVALTLTIIDRTGAAYQVDAGTLAADGRPHPLVASLGGGKALYPLRVAAITVTFQSPEQHTGGPELTLTLSGLPLAGWTEQRRARAPRSPSAPSTGPTTSTGQASTFFFDPGSSPQQVNASGPVTTTLLGGQLTLLPRTAPVTAIPAIATKAFMDANSLAIGSVVPAFVDGVAGPAADRGRGDLVPDRHRAGRRAHHRSRQPSGVPGPAVAAAAAGHASGGWPRPAGASRRP